MATPRTVAFHTLGCKLNYSETSAIGRQFERAGYAEVDFRDGADLYVINTCSVTDFADRKCRQIVRRALKFAPDAKVIVVGCYAQLKPQEIADIPGVDLVLGAAEKFRILDFVDDLAPAPGKGLVQAGAISEASSFEHAFSFGDRTRSFLKVQDGCNYNCSFCTIPLARGRSRSDTVDRVVANARHIASLGVKEIVLTGVNIGDFSPSPRLRRTGSYLSAEASAKRTPSAEASAKRTPSAEASAKRAPSAEALAKVDPSAEASAKAEFIDLIRALDRVEGIERFRISSIEPNLCTDAIIDFVADSERFVPHFHMPLQSGNNKQLAAMRRRYRRELYAQRVERIRQRMPHACIGVDLIVGFPGETREDFLESYRFVNELDVTYFHVFTYSERPNTPAADMDGAVDMGERRERNRMLTILSEKKRRAFYERHLGQTRPVLFESSKTEGRMSGFTDNYIRIDAPLQEDLLNTIAPVRLQTLSSEGLVVVELESSSVLG